MVPWGCSSGLRVFGLEALRTLYQLKQHGLGPIKRTYLKLRNKRPAESAPNAIKQAIIRGKSRTYKKRLQLCLDRLAKPPIVGIPYVLFALHYQPERATLPMGGVFGDQTLIVDLLAKAIRDGWKLLVKEHPWQLQPLSRGETQRSQEFYARIAAYPNVRLLPLHTDITKLIDNAYAVATITGSVGWQALCRGIPVLLFGAAWYRGCSGAFAVPSPEDAERALVRISKRERVDVQAVKSFLAAIEDVCVPGVLEPDAEDVVDLPLDVAASSMADLLAKVAARQTEAQ
jgi:capsular polysaccharide biosynthesis protein